jgi:hypothetical protein
LAAGQISYLSVARGFRHYPAMLLFLATILEQLDLALEHILKRDVHNARFGLMLTDNALELVLHQIAKDTANDRSFYAWRQEVDPHQAALDRAWALFRRQAQFCAADCIDDRADGCNSRHHARFPQRGLSRGPSARDYVACAVVVLFRRHMWVSWTL